MALKIKDKKLYGRNCILNNFITRENLNYRDLFVDKQSGSGSVIFPDPDPGDPKRPDSDPQHWFLIMDFAVQICCLLTGLVGVTRFIVPPSNPVNLQIICCKTCLRCAINCNNNNNKFIRN